MWPILLRLCCRAMHACNQHHAMHKLIIAKACACVMQVDSAKEAAETEVAQQQADAIAADNADGLGENRRKAVLAEAEAATAGLSSKPAASPIEACASALHHLSCQGTAQFNPLEEQWQHLQAWYLRCTYVMLDAL